MWCRIDRKGTAFGKTTACADNIKIRIEIHKITEGLNGCYSSWGGLFTNIYSNTETGLSGNFKTISTFFYHRS